MTSKLKWVFCLVAVFAPGVRGADAPAAQKRPNVLFIAIDDLRPQLGCYGDPVAKTPNLDKLASEGLLFDRAYCQQAVCSPSRSSLLTGRRPDTTKIYNLKDHFRKTLPNVVTLPQHFKNNGYTTQGFAKIFHDGLDDPISWSIPLVPTHGAIYGPVESAERDRRMKKLIADGVTGDDLARLSKGIAWEAPDVKDNELTDGITADEALAAMDTLKGKTFFLAVGFIRPHLPFVAPKKYFDLYPPAEQIQLPPNMTRPDGAPDVAFTPNFPELRSYRDVPKGQEPISDKQARELIRAYYASTSYSDALVGRLLEKLGRLGLRENTIVIVWGDHGWHLGEQGQWAKHTNFENATRAPLIISVPGQAHSGEKTNALVEFVDIFPSLVELAGLPPSEGLEGVSFVPLLKDPNRAWKSAAFSQYPRPGRIMGYTMRTDRYRYTEWRDKDHKTVATELYDHQLDPRETKNVVDAAENREIVKSLAEKMKAGWQAARPE